MSESLVCLWLNALRLCGGFPYKIIKNHSNLNDIEKCTDRESFDGCKLKRSKIWRIWSILFTTLKLVFLATTMICFYYVSGNRNLTNTSRTASNICITVIALSLSLINISLGLRTGYLAKVITQITSLCITEMGQYKSYKDVLFIVISFTYIICTVIIFIFNIFNGESILGNIFERDSKTEIYSMVLGHLIRLLPVWHVYTISMIMTLFYFIAVMLNSGYQQAYKRLEKIHNKASENSSLTLENENPLIETDITKEKKAIQKYESISLYIFNLHELQKQINLYFSVPILIIYLQIIVSLTSVLFFLTSPEMNHEFTVMGILFGISNFTNLVVLCHAPNILQTTVSFFILKKTFKVKWSYNNLISNVVMPLCPMGLQTFFIRK